VPIWLGGRTEAQISTSEAALAERRAEMDDLTDQIEGDLRKAYLICRPSRRRWTLPIGGRQVAGERWI